MTNKIKQSADSDKNKMQWWKIALFVLGILLIAGAVTYTLVTRTSANSAQPASTSSKPSATAAAGTGEMQWVINLNSKFATNDFVIVIFPGDADLTKQVDQAVKSATQKIKESGTNIESMTLSSTDPEFKQTLERLAIQKLPAVLVIAASGQGGVIKGDVTETKLFQTYLALQKNLCSRFIWLLS